MRFCYLAGGGFSIRGENLEYLDPLHAQVRASAAGAPAFPWRPDPEARQGQTHEPGPPKKPKTVGTVIYIYTSISIHICIYMIIIIVIVVVSTVLVIVIIVIVSTMYMYIHMGCSQYCG